MDIVKSLLLVLIVIFKAHILIIGILIVSYLIETITGLKLFIGHFKWKKSPYNAECAVAGDTFLYIVINLIVYVYNLFKRYVPLNIPSIVSWLLIMYFLVKAFSMFYNKYQGVDPNKADDDYT